MDLVGVISAEADPPGIDVALWRKLVAEHPALRPEQAGIDAAAVVVDGAPLGRVCWSKSGANELDVYGELAQVAQLAAALAVALGGRFVTLQELMTC